MIPIIDMHSHILPGIDDGAGQMQETRELMKLAYSQGIRRIVATPHYQRGKHFKSPQQICELVREVRQEAAAIASDLIIEEGQELAFFEEITQELASGRALTLAGSGCILIEFPEEITYSRLYQAVRSLIQEGYRPVLAHVERYLCLRDGGRLEELIQTGAYTQMNFSSLHGTVFQWKEWGWCRKQVLNGCIHVFGTDMHRMDYRPPELVRALKWLEKNIPNRMERLLQSNPAGILDGTGITG